MAVGAVPSGQYMGAIGKVVSMNGMGSLSRQVIGPTARAQSALAQLGVQPSVSFRGLGSAADYRACAAVTGAASAAANVAQAQHTQQGGKDQGWSIGIALGQMAAQVGSALCNTIDNGVHAPGAPGTAPGVADSSALVQQMLAAQERDRATATAAAQQQQYVMYGVGAALVLGAAILLLRK